MAKAISKTYTADFNIPTGFLNVDLIFSADFAGTVGGVAYSGATDEVLSFEGGAERIDNQLPVTISAGSIRLAGIQI